MWAALPLISATAVTPRRHLVAAVGRGDIGEGEGGNAQEQRQLSGSDVLVALQRATANKVKVKRKPTTSRRNDNDAAASETEGNRHSDFKSGSIAIKQLRPLCINPQWAHQLEQLETRLQQLPHA